MSGESGQLGVNMMQTGALTSQCMYILLVSYEQRIGRTDRQIDNGPRYPILSPKRLTRLPTVSSTELPSS